MKFNTILRLKGFPMSGAKAQFNSIRSKPDILEWQNSRKWEIYNYHFNHNQGYKGFIDHNSGNWEEIPIMTKVKLNKIFEQKHNNHTKTKFITGQTSGSTGQTLHYTIDYFTHAMTWSVVADRYASAGLSLDDKQARFYGINTQTIPHLLDRTKDYLANRYRMPILDLGQKSIESWIRTIQRKQFDYIYGYSYPIISFAKYLSNSNLVLKDICPTIKACIVTSERCTLKEESLIEQSFGIPVVNEYGASELGIIGFGSANKWLISDEQMMVEIVDDEGNVVPEGETGRIICTNLFNISTPFIRYEVGDMGSLIVENGRKYLTELHGRNEEMVQLPSGKKSPGDTIFLFIIKDFSTKFKEVIKEYRVVQHTKSKFEYQIVSNLPLTPVHKRYLEKITCHSLEKGISIEINNVNHIARTRLGKYRRFVSKLYN